MGSMRATGASVRWLLCLAGAASSILVLVALTMTRPVQLVDSQKAIWEQQEKALWQQPRDAVAKHSEMKLRQILSSLRKDHLLHGTRLAIRRQVPALQPWPARVVELRGPNPEVRVFEGSMLCAEGESSCVHPCDAFYTITGEEPPADCKCKCTSPNPNAFYKAGSVICTCPGSPVSAENDMFPYAPGERPEASASSDSAAATSEAPPPAIAAAPATLATQPPPAARVRGPQQVLAAGPAGLMTYMGVREHAMALENDIDARLAGMGVRVQPLSQAQVSPYAARMGAYAVLPQGKPQGLWVGAPQAFLPPDGDYPGGSTGIPMDGYLGFETGHGTEPYHGTYAPMQEAGIAARAPWSSLAARRARRSRG